MGTVSTLPGSALLNALMSQPTALVADAVRRRAQAVAGIALTDEVVEQLSSVLREATGRPQWRLEHLRDHRPFGEMLDVSRLILAQQRVLVAA